MDSNTANLVFGALIVAGVLLVALTALGTFNDSKTLQNTPSNFQQFVAAENSNDICATPPGYDEAQWRQHMGHHPDRYAQCFN